VKLPRAAEAIIPVSKIRDYLLSSSHPVGRGKFSFFVGLGFTQGRWEVLAEAVRLHAAITEVRSVESTPFGERFVLEGNLRAPDGREAPIRAVWFIETGEEIPRFVTAYPLRRPAEPR
jgi:hypothetical protein